MALMKMKTFGTLAPDQWVYIFTGPLTNTGVDHWWMLIQTDCFWYNIQFRKSGSTIELRQSRSKSDCNEAGLAEANRDKHVQIVYQNGYSTSAVSGTIGNCIIIYVIKISNQLFNYILFLCVM
eukprot:959418_1